ncbi:hypothetical protein BDQ17DRAFT_1262240, partial [Cyathus striatus]
RISNGSILAEAGNDDTANWLRNMEQARSVTGMLGATDTFRRRLYPVLVKMVPITFDPTNADHIVELLQGNNIKSEIWWNARWLKPTERRRPDQKFAHLTISLVEEG